MDTRTRLLDISRATAERHFDAQTLLVAGTPRETSWYVVALLESDDPADRDLANRILENLPFGGSGHTMTTLGFIYYHYADRLTAAARAHLIEDFRQTAPECASEHYDFGNVNHPITAFASVALAGDILGEPALGAYGRALLERFLWWIDWQHDVDRAMSVVSEYNSPTYTGTDIFGMHCLAVAAQTPETRELARRIEEKFWMEIALFYHHPTSTLSGPNSRAYQDGCFGAGSLLDGFIWKASGGRTFLDFDLCEHCHHEKDRITWSLAAVFDFHVPEQARRLLFEKRFPFEVHANAVSCGWHDGQYVVENGKKRYAEAALKYPGGYQHLSCYMTEEVSFGCADRMYSEGGQNNIFVLRWRREAPVRQRGDFRTIFLRYLVDDTLYGQDYVAASVNRPKDGFLHVMDGGRSHILHHRNKAIVLYCPKRREWRNHTRMRLGIHITEFAPLEAMWVEDRPVEDLPVDFDWTQTLYLEDGPVFVALRPLEPADFGSRTPCRIERIRDHVLVSLFNYDGPETSWDPDTMQMMHNGFTIEFGQRDEFPTLDAFRTHIRGARVVQRLVEHGIREVSYSSGGDLLDLRYDALRERILAGTVNGEETHPEYLDVTMQGEHDPAFCPTRIW
jgi:hypothetical protein